MKKLKNINWPLLGIFIVLLFFIGSYGLNSINNSKVINQYKESVSNEELEAQKEYSKEYNKDLGHGEDLEIKDIYDQGEEEVSINIFSKEKPFGTIEIPSIGVNLPLYEGTTENQLQLGAGHMIGSSLPTGDKNTRSVITAHRGLSRAKMFRELDKLKNGDIFFVDTYGEKKAYEVFDKNIILPNDTSAISIIEGEEIVTLLTCEPYMINSHRLLVDGKRVDYREEDGKIKVKTTEGKELEVKERGFFDFLTSLSLVDIEYIILIILIVALLIVKISKKIKKRKE